MEYMALGDLQSHLVDKGPFAEIDVKFISKQLFRGLEFMHQHDFVHRDLKPSNLLVKQMPPSRSWWIKMSDFGLSKKLHQSRTVSFIVCGTLGFMAPELLGFKARGKELSQLDESKAADIWAAGETVYRLLTGMASFGDNLQTLGNYVQEPQQFPRKALEANKISSEGIEFIRRCMAPSPFDRPSANCALEELRWPMTHGRNKYRNITTETTCTKPCRGNTPPFILFTPEGDHLVVIEPQRVFVWNMESETVVNSYVGKTKKSFCHGSIHPDGRYLCVTQAKWRKPLILEDAIDLEDFLFIEGDFDGLGDHPTISTFSPDGRILAIARNSLLCQIEIEDDWATTNSYYLATTPDRESGENRIKSLQFMKDGSKLIVACETDFIIMDTAADSWFKKQVIEYPCLASSLDISPGGKIVACGSATGELWLWASQMECWVRRMMPHGGPGAESDAVENVRFSATGGSILYNCRGHFWVKMWRSVPLDRIDFSSKLRYYHGGRMGHSVTYPIRGLGATALGGDGGASVVFWKYEL